jgi:hypothetical protein
VFAPRRRTERMRSVRFIVAGGVVFPTITLGALLIYGLMRAVTDWSV